MKLFFDRNKFIKNAPNNIKRSLPQKHLDALDGIEVEFSDCDKFGTVPTYFVDNNRGIDSFYLYPVDKQWCSNKQQVKLF